MAQNGKGEIGNIGSGQWFGHFVRSPIAKATITTRCKSHIATISEQDFVGAQLSSVLTTPQGDNRTAILPARVPRTSKSRSNRKRTKKSSSLKGGRTKLAELTGGRRGVSSSSSLAAAKAFLSRSQPQSDAQMIKVCKITLPSPEASKQRVNQLQQLDEPRLRTPSEELLNPQRAVQQRRFSKDDSKGTTPKTNRQPIGAKNCCWQLDGMGLTSESKPQELPIPRSKPWFSQNAKAVTELERRFSGKETSEQTSAGFELTVATFPRSKSRLCLSRSKSRHRAEQWEAAELKPLDLLKQNTVPEHFPETMPWCKQSDLFEQKVAGGFDAMSCHLNDIKQNAAAAKPDACASVSHLSFRTNNFKVTNDGDSHTVLPKTKTAAESEPTLPNLTPRPPMHPSPSPALPSNVILPLGSQLSRITLNNSDSDSNSDPPTPRGPPSFGKRRLSVLKRRKSGSLGQFACAPIASPQSDKLSVVQLAKYLSVDRFLFYKEALGDGAFAQVRESKHPPCCSESAVCRFTEFDSQQTVEALHSSVFRRPKWWPVILRARCIVQSTCSRSGNLK